MAANPASLQRRLCHQYLRHGAPLISISARPPASSILPMALRHCALAGSISATAMPSASSILRMALRCSALASSIPDTPPRPSASPRRRPGRNISYTAPLPATNLIWRRRSPVWLAIWRTWAGFANSQHRNAAFATPDNICAHSSLLQTLSCCSDRRKSVGPSAPIAYATSVSPPNEAAAWQGRRCCMLDMAVAWPGAAFLQITTRTNPRSRHLWGTLARAVASI